jgi:hypothetical protein
MSELARVILRGTDQQLDAMQGLAAARERRTQRKQVAMAAVTRSLQEAGESFAKHRSWADAKASEREIAEMSNAETLARAQGKPVPVALAATLVSSKAGADFQTKRIDAWTGEEKDRIQVKLQTAQAHKYEQDTLDAQKKAKQDETDRAERKTNLTKYVLPADASDEERLARDEYAAGRIETKDYVSMLKANEIARKNAAKETADAAKLQTTDATARYKANLSATTAKEIATAQIGSREAEGGLNRGAAQKRLETQLLHDKTAD